MGVGVDLPGWVLSQADAFVVLEVSAVAEAVQSGVTQRVYALGQQRAIQGFAARTARTLTVESASPGEREWLTRRAGELVTVRDTTGGTSQAVVGDLGWTLDPSKSESVAYGMRLVLFYARESN